MSYAATQWGSPLSMLSDTTCKKCYKPVTEFELKYTRSSVLKEVIMYRCNTMDSMNVYCSHSRYLCPFCSDYFTPVIGNLRKHISTHFPDTALQNSSVTSAQWTGFNRCSYCPFSFQNMSIGARYDHALSHFKTALQELQDKMEEESDEDEEDGTRGGKIQGDQRCARKILFDNDGDTDDDMSSMTDSCSSFTQDSDMESDISAPSDDDDIDIRITWKSQPIFTRAQVAHSSTQDVTRISSSIVSYDQPDLCIIGVPPVQSVSILGLESPQAEKVIIDWWLVQGFSDTGVNDIIQSIRRGEMNVDRMNSPIPVMPTSLRSYKEKHIAKWDYMRPIRQPGSLKKSVLYSLRHHLARILASKRHMSQMNFSHIQPSNRIVSEFYHTQGFKQLVDRAPEDTLPVIIILYYDTFATFQKKGGSTGGLYFTLMNFNRTHISKVRSMFCLGCIDTKENIMDVYNEVVNELIQLQSGFKAQIAVTDTVTGDVTLKWAKIEVMLGMVVGDMPQRHVNASVLACTSDHGACSHCMVRKSDLLDTDIKQLRTTDTVLQWREQWSRLKTKKARNIFNYRCGMKFTAEVKEGARHGHIPAHMNPFWRLSDPSVKYKFCIYQNSMVDFFHAGILGLLRKHFDLLWDDGLEPKERRALENALDTLSVPGIATRPLKDREFWNGDDWLAFFSVSPFILYDVLQGTDAGMQHFECWMSHIEYLTVMLSEGLSNDQIEYARRRFQEWQRQMLDIFEERKLCIPNFHAMLHVFDQATMWGPPILHWTRPFEHRHLLLRRQVKRSNMRNILSWIVKRDMLLEHIHYVRPDLELRRSHRAMQRSLKTCGPDSLVVCRHPSTQAIRYAQITQIYTATNEMDVQFFILGPLHRQLHCYKFTNKKEVEQFRIKKEQVLQRFIITKGMVNRFCVLNTVRI